MPVRGGRKSLHTPGYDLIVLFLREARVTAAGSQTELAARRRTPAKLCFHMRTGRAAGGRTRIAVIPERLREHASGLSAADAEGDAVAQTRSSEKKPAAFW